MSLFIFLTVLQAIVATALVGVILIQRSEGGGLGVGGSPAGLMSARGAANFLTRMTTFLAIAFVSLSIALAVAYEPVWAIGTGRVAAVGDVIAMHAALRPVLAAAYGEAGEKVRILYGGSVNAGNAAELLAAPGVGGALVGGASLTAEAFLPIVAAAGGDPVD